MLVHDHKNDKSEVFDFRETAPSQIKASMFADDESKIKLVSSQLIALLNTCALLAHPGTEGRIFNYSIQTLMIFETCFVY